MIFVTGATGNVGCDLVPELLNAGARVRAGVHAENKSLLATAPEVERVPIDFQNTEAMARAFEGCRALYLVTPFDPFDTEMGYRIVDAAREAGIRYVVKQSIMGAESLEGAIARHHRAVEEYVEESGLAWVFLRPNFFMQNFVQFWGRDIAMDSRFYLPLAEGSVSYIDGRDVASVAAALLLDQEETYAGQAFTLTGPEALSNDDVAARITEAVGRKIEYVEIDDNEFRRRYADDRLLRWKMDALLELHRLHRKNSAAEITDQVERLAKIKPTTFAEFAVENIDAFLPAKWPEPPVHEHVESQPASAQDNILPGSRTIH